MKSLFVDISDAQKKSLQLLKATTDRSIRSLVAEGIAHVIKKYGSNDPSTRLHGITPLKQKTEAFSVNDHSQKGDSYDHKI